MRLSEWHIWRYVIVAVLFCSVANCFRAHDDGEHFSHFLSEMSQKEPVTNANVVEGSLLADLFRDSPRGLQEASRGGTHFHEATSILDDEVEAKQVQGLFADGWALGDGSTTLVVVHYQLVQKGPPLGLLRHVVQLQEAVGSLQAHTRMASKQRPP